MLTIFKNYTQQPLYTALALLTKFLMGLIHNDTLNCALRTTLPLHKLHANNYPTFMYLARTC